MGRRVTPPVGKAAARRAVSMEKAAALRRPPAPRGVKCCRVMCRRPAGEALRRGAQSGLGESVELLPEVLLLLLSTAVASARWQARQPL
jgi:hypothetical protein